MPTRPASHIDDSHLLQADGEVVLYEITPSTGTGTIRLKPDNTVTWLGNTYTGLPMTISGEKQESDSGYANPRLVIGQDNIDLSIVKPLVFDGTLDNALVKKHTVLRANIESNTDIKETMIYRVKQVEGYNMYQITLLLATYSDSLNFQLPIMAYDQPDFPTVQMV